MEQTLKLLNALIAALGEVATLGDAKTWIQVEENAQALLDQEAPNEPTA